MISGQRPMEWPPDVKDSRGEILKPLRGHQQDLGRIQKPSAEGESLQIIFREKTHNLAE